MISSRKYYTTLAIVSLIAIVLIVTTWFASKKITIGETANQYKITETIKAGEPLKGKYTIQTVPVSEALSKEEVVTDAKLLDTSVAAVDIAAHTPVSKSLVKIEDPNLERTVEVSIPVTVEGSVGNKVSDNDIIAIKVSHKDVKDDDVVVSSIAVKELRTANGLRVTGESELPAFVVFDVTNEEATKLKNAAKDGTLYFLRYTDLNSERLAETYIVPGTEAKKEDKPEVATPEGEVKEEKPEAGEKPAQ